MLLLEKAEVGGSRTTSGDSGPAAVEGPEVEGGGETEEGTINAKMI